MTLPYPYEVETGALRPVPLDRRAPLDLRAVLRAAIRSDGDNVVVLGRALTPTFGLEADEVRDDYRRTLTVRFLQRRPNADLATWQSFVDRARPALTPGQKADERTLKTLLGTVDGL